MIDLLTAAPDYPLPFDSKFFETAKPAMMPREFVPKFAQRFAVDPNSNSPVSGRESVETLPSVSVGLDFKKRLNGSNLLACPRIQDCWKCDMTSESNRIWRR